MVFWLLAMGIIYYLYRTAQRTGTQDYIYWNIYVLYLSMILTFSPLTYTLCRHAMPQDRFPSMFFKNFSNTVSITLVLRWLHPADPSPHPHTRPPRCLQVVFTIRTRMLKESSQCLYSYPDTDLPKKSDKYFKEKMKS